MGLSPRCPCRRRSGEPAATDAAGVTVVAPSTEEGEVLAKCALILGTDIGLTMLGEAGVEGLTVLNDRSTRATMRWPGLVTLEAAPSSALGK